MILASVFAAGLNGCTDLGENVYTSMLAEGYYQDEQQVETAMATVYSLFRGLTEHSNWWDLEETTDIAVTPVRQFWAWFDGGIYIRLHQHSWGESDAHLNNIWTVLFAGVTNTTWIIDMLEKMDDFTNRELYIAEMRAARAFNYYLLCETFGNVPIYDVYTQDQTYLPETKSRKEVYEFIEKELKECAGDLSEDPAATYGRFNKWNAKMLLARLYLNAEAWVGENKYAECLALCNEIILSDKYELDDDYSTPFCVQNEQLSKENMFVLPFDAVETAGSQIYMMARKTLHWSSMNTWKMANTWVDSGGCGVPSFFDNYISGDKRLGKTWLMGQQYSWDGSPLETWWWLESDTRPLVYTKEIVELDGGATFTDGYRFGKYEIEMEMGQSPNNDYVMMRYAEVLMMKAECILRTNGTAQDAADIVNDVRGRAFDTLVDITAAELTATENYNGVPVKYARLLQELGVEFALEGLRRSQLIRFDDNFTKGTWWEHTPTNDTKRNLMLIPLPQLQSNRALEQNPV